MSDYVDPYIDLKGSRKLDDGRWEHCFSQSFLNTFMQCPEQARAEYFHEVDWVDTDSTARGKAVHGAIEYALDNKRRGLEVPTLDELVDVARHELDVIGEWRYTKISKRKVYESVEPMLEGWLRDIEPHVEPNLIEFTFKRLLYEGKHRTIYVGGTMDCVDVENIVWDWKTASQRYERWEKQRWALQPTIYCYAVSESDWPTRGLFRYGVVFDNGDTQILDIWRDETHVAWLRQICSQVAWLIEHEVNPWPLNDHGWHCSERWCPKFDSCKGLHIHEDWKASA